MRPGNDGAGMNDDLADDEAQPDGEKDDDLPPGKAGDIAAEEEKKEADGGDEAGHAEAADLQLDINPDDPAEQQQRRKHREPESQRLEARSVGSDGWRR